MLRPLLGSGDALTKVQMRCTIAEVTCKLGCCPASLAIKDMIWIGQTMRLLLVRMQWTVAVYKLPLKDIVSRQPHYNICLS